MNIQNCQWLRHVLLLKTDFSAFSIQRTVEAENIFPHKVSVGFGLKVCLLEISLCTKYCNYVGLTKDILN